LECRDFCPLLDASAGVASALSHGHFETAGVVTGWVRRKDRDIGINGFGWRDHSWGPRDWNGFVLNHRWIAGTFGPELSYFALTIQGANGDFFPIGFIMQNETVRVTRDFDLVMYMEVDGLTHRGGELVFQFPDSANISIRFTALDGALFRRGALASHRLLQCGNVDQSAARVSTDKNCRECESRKRFFHAATPPDRWLMRGCT
jgi:hypothetical protein